MNNTIRIEEISLGINSPEAELKTKIASILLISESEILSYKIAKKAIDSRKKSNIHFVYCVDVVVSSIKDISKLSSYHRVRLQEPFVYNIKKVKARNPRPLVVGFGPAGMFAALALSIAGLRPIVIERGQEIDKRVKSVDDFFKNTVLNSESNIQFGEGGAGTFSDGKLYTLINDPRSAFIFNHLVEAGAPAEILTSATPHIGTDRLRVVVKNMRQRIIELGAEIRFNTKLSELEIKDDKLVAVVLNDSEHLLVDTLVLATGHSARDTYQMIYDNKLEMIAKSFAIGVRI